ncbi:MAG: urease accessory protein UreD [Pirellulales bacterium]|nr:urease accessory protein UreD [Pirellulales bacterium]
MRPWDGARELAPYQDEPPQLPSGSFGKNAWLRLAFERRGERTVLTEAFRRAPLIVQRALYWDEEMPGLPCVFIITNSGGILQGDRYEIEMELAAGAQAHVTTQAATKIHEMDANFAAQSQHISLADGAYLEYLPDPVIPHRHARFHTHTTVSIAPSATLLYSEIIMGGRKYYGDGELYQYDLFSSTVSAAREERELFVEKFLIEPARNELRQPGSMGAFDVFGNVLLLTPKAHADAIFAETPAEWRPEEGWAAGASRLPNDAGLIYKVLGAEAHLVKARVREFWSRVRPIVAGAAVPAEFPWR